VRLSLACHVLCLLTLTCDDAFPFGFSSFSILQRVDIAMEPLNSTASHTLTIEVVSGLGGVYVQSCSINGAPLPAAIIPHDVLQVMLAACHVHACVALRPFQHGVLQPPAAGPISNASAVYLGVDAHSFADGSRCCNLCDFV
jgi:hypothetical protein